MQLQKNDRSLSSSAHLTIGSLAFFQIYHFSYRFPLTYLVIFLLPFPFATFFKQTILFFLEKTNNVSMLIIHLLIFC